jgi:hypothetical protein
VDLDRLPVSRARLAMVEPALFEWEVFEMAAPIQSPTKCEVPSVIRFLNAKFERPADIHKQIVVAYDDVMNRQNVTKWCLEYSERRTDVHYGQRSGDRIMLSEVMLHLPGLYIRISIFHFFAQRPQLGQGLLILEAT